VGPLVALVVLGASYLINCLTTLTSPGVPIKLEYKSEGGNLTLTADSFSYSLQQGRLFVSKARLVGPQGLIASAKSLSASGLQLFRIESTPTRFTVFDSQFVLRRNERGRLEIESYIPKRKGPPSAVPFSVRADRTRLTFVDTGPDGTVQQSAFVRNANVDGIGNEWLAGGVVDLDQIGTIQASVER